MSEISIDILSELIVSALKAAYSVTFDIFILKIMFIFIKNDSKNTKNGHSWTFYIELRMKPMGVGLNLALSKEY